MRNDHSTPALGSPSALYAGSAHWRLGLLGLLALTLSLPLLQGCAAALVAGGVGAAVGATVMVRDRRGQDAILADQEIDFKGKDWFSSDHQCQVTLTSYNRVALLTGQCRDETAARAYAERIGKIPQVKEVVDEISVGPFASLQRQGEDAYITSKVKIALINVRLPDYDPTRVKVVTESGVVYLMGLLTPAEQEATVQEARYVSGVEKVVKVFEPYTPSPERPSGEASSQASEKPAHSDPSRGGFSQESAALQ